jgi:serine/threonine-protein kinase HipA
MRHGLVLVNGQRAGVLSETDARTYRFVYDPTYQVQAVSVTLPRRAAAYDSPDLFPFFAGLLAEGPLAESQCRELKIDERDFFGRLLATCRDAIGAVTVEPLESDQQTSAP